MLSFFFPIALIILGAAIVAGAANRRRDMELVTYTIFTGGISYLVWVPLTSGLLALFSFGLGIEFALVDEIYDADLAGLCQGITAFLCCLGTFVHARTTRFLAGVRPVSMDPAVFVPAPGNPLFRRGPVR